MALNNVQDIERAIETLEPKEWEELCVWLDEYQHPLDTRIEADVEAGRLDHAILRALSDERNGEVQPL
jgi:hypothetical protein